MFSFWLVFSLLSEKSGSRLADSRCGLGCSFLLAAVFFAAVFEAALIGVGVFPWLFAGRLLGLWGCKSGLGLGEKVELAFAGDIDVSGEDKTEGKPGELVVL